MYSWNRRRGERAGIMRGRAGRLSSFQLSAFSWLLARHRDLRDRASASSFSGLPPWRTKASAKVGHPDFWFLIGVADLRKMEPSFSNSASQRRFRDKQVSEPAVCFFMVPSVDFDPLG